MKIQAGVGSGRRDSFTNQTTCRVVSEKPSRSLKISPTFFVIQKKQLKNFSPQKKTTKHGCVFRVPIYSNGKFTQQKNVTHCDSTGLRLLKFMGPVTDTVDGSVNDYAKRLVYFMALPTTPIKTTPTRNTGLNKALLRDNGG